MSRRAELTAAARGIGAPHPFCDDRPDGDGSRNAQQEPRRKVVGRAGEREPDGFDDDRHPGPETDRQDDADDRDARPERPRRKPASRGHVAGDVDQRERKQQIPPQRAGEAPTGAAPCDQQDTVRRKLRRLADHHMTTSPSPGATPVTPPGYRELRRCHGRCVVDYPTSSTAGSCPQRGRHRR